MTLKPRYLGVLIASGITLLALSACAPAATTTVETIPAGRAKNRLRSWNVGATLQPGLHVRERRRRPTPPPKRWGGASVTMARNRPSRRRRAARAMRDGGARSTSGSARCPRAEYGRGTGSADYPVLFSYRQQARHQVHRGETSGCRSPDPNFACPPRSEGTRKTSAKLALARAPPVRGRQIALALLSTRGISHALILPGWSDTGSTAEYDARAPTAGDPVPSLRRGFSPTYTARPLSQ